MSIQNQFEKVLQDLSQSLKFDRAGVLIIDENRVNGFYNSIDSERLKLDAMFLLNDPVLAQLHKERMPIIIPDIAIDNRFLTWPDMQSIRGWMGVPIHIQDRMVGILSIGSLEPFAYSEEDMVSALKFSEKASVILAEAIATADQGTDEIEDLKIKFPDSDQSVGKSNLEVLLRNSQNLLGEQLSDVKCVFLISENGGKSFIPYELSPHFFRDQVLKFPETIVVNSIFNGLTFTNELPNCLIYL